MVFETMAHSTEKPHEAAQPTLAQGSHTLKRRTRPLRQSKLKAAMPDVKFCFAEPKSALLVQSGREA